MASVKVLDQSLSMSGNYLHHILSIYNVVLYNYYYEAFNYNVTSTFCISNYSYKDTNGMPNVWLMGHCKLFRQVFKNQSSGLPNTWLYHYLKTTVSLISSFLNNIILVLSCWFLHTKQITCNLMLC